MVLLKLLLLTQCFFIFVSSHPKIQGANGFVGQELLPSCGAGHAAFQCPCSTALI